ncbi:pentatricopeptide repeat-containing protein At4g21065-like [Castanea sativa]|uniref:pentatricopeptide repeat-containing protein At4g21065-like n=1 Tax=Castanea sativa TaxID=21020 RepID=UPI003F653474
MDQGTLVVAIKRCTTVRDLETIQAYMIRTNFTQDSFLLSKLIESYAITLPIRQIAHAYKLFSWTHQPNLFMWNTIIRGYSINDSSSLKAIALYKDMHLSGISSNSFTFGFVLKACCNLPRLEEGKMLHSQVLKMGLDYETHVVNGLIKLYTTCGRVDEAHDLFDEMPERDLVSWSTMVSGYVQNGCSNEALVLFKQMQAQNVKADEFTLASVVGACGDMGALDLGKWVHSYIDKEGIDIDIVLGTSLVDMYSKCGSLDNAIRVFEGMSKRDVMAWSTMIGGCAIHGFGEKALKVFHAMKSANVRPNSVTFTSVLCACSHSGLVEEGRQYFNSMSLEYGITPQIEHYGCMVDLFCRAGLVLRAHKFIQKMPIKPNAVLWRTLLGACKTHGYKELSESITREVLELEPHSAENYVLVSNVYASLGRWSSVSKVRSQMKHKKAKKQHGWSSIEMGFVVHQFVMGDELHPEIRQIYPMLDQMAKKLKQEGHVATTIDVLHDIDEEEKEHALGFHSERLAIAYGLLRLSKDSPIRIVKNLRVCADCHSVIKLISSVYKRDIIVRDRIRFHHFREGKCSCNDYW